MDFIVGIIMVFIVEGGTTNHYFEHFDFNSVEECEEFMDEGRQRLYEQAPDAIVRGSCIDVRDLDTLYARMAEL